MNFSLTLSSFHGPAPTANSNSGNNNSGEGGSKDGGNNANASNNNDENVNMYCKNMNVDIKNIHTIYSLLTNHSEKVISIIGNAENMKAQEVLELAHKKGIKIQPKNTKKQLADDFVLHDIGCLGKISSFTETNDGRLLIELKGVIRFKVIKEIISKKKYRECEVSFENFYDDLNDKNENLKFSDLELVFKDLKNLFEKRGFIINWKDLEKQSLDETINALAMASPFTLEEKQVLLEAKDLDIRKTKIAEILKTYSFDKYNNTTIQ